MIQRIQTIYLLISSGLLFSLFFGTFTKVGEEVVKFADYRPFLIFTIITFVISFLSIFLYRHRILQMRFCIYNILVLIGFQSWIAYMFFTRIDGSSFTISSVFPIVAAIFTFLAFSGIRKDEALVQSSNSLRDLSKNKKLWKK